VAILGLLVYRMTKSLSSVLQSGLGEWVNIPCTYAGGARGELSLESFLVDRMSLMPRTSTTELADLELVDRLSQGKVDLTYGR
jgi:phosphoribosylformimino-5-aminoimidazole carboxamide ribotide isomerase